MAIRWLVLVAMTVLGSSPSPPCPQLPVFQSDAAQSGVPFGAPPAVPLRVLNDPTSVVALEAWVHAVSHHKAGEVDDAWQKVAAFTLYELRIIRTACLNGMLPVGQDQAFGILKRAVLLHTDIATHQMQHSQKADLATNAAGAVHFGMAMALVEMLRPRGESAAFCRAWYTAIGAFLLSQRELTVTPTFCKFALSIYKSDPRLLLMAGTVHELRASQRVQEASDLGAALTAIGGAGANLRQAEHYYRQALQADPDCVEARVRLGRVLGQVGRHAEALAELGKAQRATEKLVKVEPALNYFLYLFLGDEEAAQSHTEEARAAYHRAIALFPGDSVYLSLSRLELRVGSREAALAAVANLRPSTRRFALADPWWDYFSAGSARQLEEEFAALRRTAEGPK